jgi:hypothetical protein
LRANFFASIFQERTIDHNALRLRIGVASLKRSKYLFSKDLRSVVIEFRFAWEALEKVLELLVSDDGR